MQSLYLYVMGFLFIGYTYKFNRELLRIDLKGTGKFLLALLGITAMRVVMFNLFPEKGASVMMNLDSIQWWQTVLAGFEEAIFTLPMLYIAKYADNKYIKAISMGALALTFGIGHLYQGIYGVIVTSYYMFKIAPKYMKLYGFYTMVVCHILFDLSAYFFIKYAYNLLFI